MNKSWKTRHRYQRMSWIRRMLEQRQCCTVRMWQTFCLSSFHRQVCTSPKKQKYRTSSTHCIVSSRARKRGHFTFHIKRSTVRDPNNETESGLVHFAEYQLESTNSSSLGLLCSNKKCGSRLVIDLVKIRTVPIETITKSNRKRRYLKLEATYDEMINKKNYSRLLRHNHRPKCREGQLFIKTSTLKYVL